MKIFLQILLWLIIIIIAIPVCILALYFTERLLGYFPGEAPWKVAEIAAKKGDVSICKRIINPFPAILGPTSADARISCIHEYAKLTHDPSVCERLMPSSYGLSCVGAAMANRLCVIRPDNTVSGNGISVSLNQCINGPKDIRSNACCTIALVSSILSINDCSALSSNQPFYDECTYRLSFKNHDPSTCESIQDPNIKAGCIVSATALQKNPSICSGCTPPINSINDLK